MVGTARRAVRAPTQSRGANGPRLVPSRSRHDCRVRFNSPNGLSRTRLLRLCLCVNSSSILQNRDNSSARPAHTRTMKIRGSETNLLDEQTRFSTPSRPDAGAQSGDDLLGAPASRWRVSMYRVSGTRRHAGAPRVVDVTPLRLCIHPWLNCVFEDEAGESKKDCRLSAFDPWVSHSAVLPPAAGPARPRGSRWRSSPRSARSFL